MIGGLLPLSKNKFDPWAWKENNDPFPPFIENCIMKSLFEEAIQSMVVDF